MHAYLTRLGVRLEVQNFFAPFYRSDANGDLVFDYAGKSEIYGFAYHRVPVSEQYWLAGEQDFKIVKKVFISESAMDAIAFLNFRYQSFMALDQLLFISIGSGLRESHCQSIRSNLSKKKLELLFANDLLGKVKDVKMAAGLQGLAIKISEKHSICEVNFRQRNYQLPAENFSLNAFERISTFRFGVSTIKPKGFSSFFEQLKADAF